MHACALILLIFKNSMNPKISPTTETPIPIIKLIFPTYFEIKPKFYRGITYARSS